MDPRFSAKQYPRRDNVFKTKKSLNFDLVKTKVFMERKPGKCIVFMEWVAFGIIGVLVGFVASIMSYIEEGLTEWKRDTT